MWELSHWGRKAYVRFGSKADIWLTGWGAFIPPFDEYSFYLAPDAELVVVPIPLGSGSSIRCLFKCTIQTVLLDEVLGYRFWIVAQLYSPLACYSGFTIGCPF